MYKLRRPDGSIIDQQAKILKEQWDFSAKLYAQEKVVIFGITNDTEIFLGGLSLHLNHLIA